MEILLNLLKWSLIAGIVTLLASLLKPLLDRRFSPRWRYWLWLVLAAALVLAPVRWESLLPSLPEPAVRVEVPEVRVPVSRPAADVTPNRGEEIPVTDPTAPPVQVQPVTPQTPAPTPTPETKAAKTVELSVLLTALWFTGAAAFLLWYAIGTARLSDRAQRWSVPVSAEIQELYSRTAGEMGIHRAPRLGVSREVTSPMAVGLLRPRLWLPDRGYGQRELTFILRHELTHIKRRDLWYKALMVLANALHWFDPLVWLLRREASETVELLCDSQTLTGSDEETRRAYCETLLASICRKRDVALTTLFYGGIKTMKNRFNNLLTGENRRFGWTVLLACILAVAVTACTVSMAAGPEGNGNPYDITEEDPYGIRNEGGFNVYYSVKEAHVIDEDGWVYGFVHYIDKTGDQSDIIRYHFYVINLRHRYDERYTGIYVVTMDKPGDEREIRFFEIPAMLSWNYGSDAQKRDLERVNEILSFDKEPEDLLALDPEDFEFEVLDKDLFFELLHTALEGEPVKEGTDFAMWEKPGNDFLWEQSFTDGYKFQVSYMTQAGNLEELFIDVLYPTGEGYADYIQLSDLVKDGTATAEQRELYAFIDAIARRAKTENCFSAGTEEYADIVLDGVDFSRLSVFMRAIQNNTYFDDYFQPSIFERIEEEHP